MLCSLHLVDKPTTVTDTSRSLLDVIMVYLNGDIGDWFRTTVGVRQGYLLSPTLFNIFLERIMTEALEDHQRTVSIGGRTIKSTYVLLMTLMAWQEKRRN